MKALSVPNTGTRCCAWENALATEVLKRCAIRELYINTVLVANRLSLQVNEMNSLDKS